MVGFTGLIVVDGMTHIATDLRHDVDPNLPAVPSAKFMRGIRSLELGFLLTVFWAVMAAIESSERWLELVRRVVAVGLFVCAMTEVSVLLIVDWIDDFRSDAGVWLFCGFYVMLLGFGIIVESIGVVGRCAKREDTIL